MSSPPHSPDGTDDDYTVQQENELEALAAIFGDDFEDLRTKKPWKVPDLFLTVLPTELLSCRPH